MTSDEFAKWWRDYRERFPGKSSWFTRCGPETLSTWEEILESTTLGDALEANKRIQMKTVEVSDEWDATPVEIRNIAEQVKIDRICASHRASEEPPEVSHGSDRKPWVCAMCDNTGLVRKTQWVDGKEYETAFACKCRLGDKFAVWKKRDGTVEDYPRAPSVTMM